MIGRKACGWGLVGAVCVGVVAQPARPLIVAGGSMAPTYGDGAFLWTTPVDRPLRRGDVVIVDTPTGTIIKRVALLGGDRRLQWRASNGGWIDLTTYVPPSNPACLRRMRQAVVPSGSVFLLGDNLQRSIDSRSFGPVPIGNVRRLVLDQRPPDACSWVAGIAARGWLASAVRPLATRMRGI